MNTVYASLAVLAFLTAPVMGQVPTLTFKNDLPRSIVVQTVTVVRGISRRDMPQLLKTGQTSTAIPLDGDKLVFVHDGRTNHVLHRNAIKAGRISYYFRVLLNPRTSKVVLYPARPPITP